MLSRVCLAWSVKLWLKMIINWSLKGKKEPEWASEELMLMPTSSAATHSCPHMMPYSLHSPAQRPVACLPMTPLCLGPSKNQAVNVIALIINVIHLRWKWNGWAGAGPVDNCQWLAAAGSTSQGGVQTLLQAGVDWSHVYGLEISVIAEALSL